MVNARLKSQIWGIPRRPPGCVLLLLSLLAVSAPLPAALDNREPDPCFIVRGKNGHALTYVYFEEEPGRRPSALVHHRSVCRLGSARYDIASLVMQLAAPHQAPSDVGRLQRSAFCW
jgi:hypothetical protein